MNVARCWGREHAIATAKVYLLAGHEDGQLPFAVSTGRTQHGDRTISDCQQWIAEHYAQPNPVAAMVSRSGLTQRRFSRRFRAATGQMAMDYVRGLRLEAAKRLIERGGGAIDAVAQQVGYEDSAFFRRLFRREVGLSPAAYRRKFNVPFDDPGRRALRSSLPSLPSDLRA